MIGPLLSVGRPSVGRFASSRCTLTFVDRITTNTAVDFRLALLVWMVFIGTPRFALIASPRSFFNVQSRMQTPGRSDPQAGTDIEMQRDTHIYDLVDTNARLDAGTL